MISLYQMIYKLYMCGAFVCGQKLRGKHDWYQKNNMVSGLFTNVCVLMNACENNTKQLSMDNQLIMKTQLVIRKR